MRTLTRDSLTMTIRAVMKGFTPTRRNKKCNNAMHTNEKLYPLMRHFRAKPPSWTLHEQNTPKRNHTVMFESTTDETELKLIRISVVILSAAR